MINWIFQTLSHCCQAASLYTAKIVVKNIQKTKRNNTCVSLVDGIFPAGDVHFVTVEKARSTGAHPHKAFAVSKKNRTTEVENRVRANFEGKARAFIDCWYSDEGRALLKAAMETCLINP